jgi:hypothetical protein
VSGKRTDFYCAGWAFLWQTFGWAFGGAGGRLGGDGCGDDERYMLDWSELFAC